MGEATDPNRKPTLSPAPAPRPAAGRLPGWTESGRKTFIKVCGVTRPQDALAAVEAGADAIGVIFAARSRRRVSAEQAADVTSALPWHVAAVGVFADEPVESLIATARTAGLGEVQLHGNEGPGYVAELISRAPELHILKALSVTDGTFADRAHEWWSAAEVGGYRSRLWGLVLDSPGGGTGRTVDWGLIAAARSAGRFPEPFFQLVLAGGLTADNVGEAIAVARPDFVDVAGGVESAPGLKDPARLAAFCAAVRRADGRER
jgi:phosphoribosylanthranilate isomerase